MNKFFYILLLNISIVTYIKTQMLSPTITSTLYPQATSMISLFGEEIVGRRQDFISIAFQYGISAVDTNSAVTATGSVQAANSMAIVSTGTNSTGYAFLESNDSMQYNSGHESHAYFSAVFAQAGAANSTQWIGAFTTTDGAAVGYSNTNFSVLYRNNSIDTIINQSSFNLDRLDGTGASGFTLDPTKINVFRIAYGWLSSSPIQFQILIGTSQIVTFHSINPTNTSTATSFSNPTLPIAMQVQNNGNTSNISIGSGSWNGCNVQRPNNAGARLFTFNTQGSTSTPNTENLLAVFLNSTTFNGILNQNLIRFKFFSALPYTTVTQICLLFFRKNATVTGTSYFQFNSTDSCMQISSIGTVNTATGQLVMVLPISYLGGTLTSFPLSLDTKGVSITLNPGETLAVTEQSIVANATISIGGGITWEEIH